MPDSHFHTPTISAWLRTYGFEQAQFSTERAALDAIFDAARKRGSGKTDMFGLRLQRSSFDFFMQRLNVLHPNLPSDNERLQAAFGSTLLIYLKRSNKLDQAISYIKATQTGLWHRAPDGNELERLSAHKEPIYDAKAITAQIEHAKMLDEQWEDWFTGESIEPMRITYDQLSSDPRKVLVEILNRLGVDYEPKLNMQPPVAKLADKVSHDWAEQYHRDVCGHVNK